MISLVEKIPDKNLEVRLLVSFKLFPFYFCLFMCECSSQKWLSFWGCEIFFEVILKTMNEILKSKSRLEKVIDS